MRPRCLLIALPVALAACSVAGVPSGPSSGSPALSPSPTVSERPSPSAAVSDSPSAEEWDLLWISDSSGSGDVAPAFAARIEEDLGVSVRVRPAWSANQSIRTVLDVLRGQDGGTLRTWGAGDVDLPAAVREAEIIVVSGNQLESPTEGHPASGCMGDCTADISCGPETWTQYEADLVAVFDEIFAIREGRPVVLRTHDYYLPWGPRARWEACGQVAVCADCHREWSMAIHRAGAARGVPVARYLAAFSGPAFDQPMPSAWTVDEPGHPSREGAEHFAEVMAGLGYDPVAPPGG